jgi:hypothetical protein
MPRARTSKSRAAHMDRPRRHTSPPVLASGEAELARELGVYTFFFDIPRFEVVYFRLVLESWEDGAVARTIERCYQGDATRSLVVALVVPDFLEPCVRRLSRLCAEIDGAQVPSTAALHEALRADLTGEAAGPEAID